MAGRLDDKVIIVAGGGGIGSGLARRYAAEGARVVLGDLDGDGAVAAAAAIDPAGERVIGTALDGADDGSIAAIVALALSKFGKLSGFHANYASFADARSDYDVLTLPMDVYDQVMDVNARGYVLCTRHAVPAMIDSNGGGSIVYTSSGDAYSGPDVRVSYAMSKAALHALMRHVARRFGGENIRANVIAPGFILHPRMAAMLPPEFPEMARKRNVIKSRVGCPDDIAAMGAFLLSEEAGYITGQVMNVDGGALMRP